MIFYRWINWYFKVYFNSQGEVSNCLGEKQSKNLNVDRQKETQSISNGKISSW